MALINASYIENVKGQYRKRCLDGAVGAFWNVYVAGPARGRFFSRPGAVETAAEFVVRPRPDSGAGWSGFPG